MNALRLLRIALWGLTIVALVGVGGTLFWIRAKKTETPHPFLGASGTGSPELRLHLPTVVDLTVGENRLAFGFTDKEGRLLTDKDVSDVRVIVYDLISGKPKATQTLRPQYLRPGWRELSKATYYQNPNVLVDGFFKTSVMFTHVGQWGLDFVVYRPGRKPFSQRVLPNVLSEGPTPPVGAPAPRSRNPTLKDVGGDLSKLDSDPRLNDVEMHRTSIAEAIAAGQPAVVIFSTPGFCESRICLPDTEILYSLYPEYGDKVAFIHAEVYKNFGKYQEQVLKGELESEPGDLELSDTVKEWGLQNDPYIFFIDRGGFIFAKFFGPVARSEIKETLERLVSHGE
jgi:hypothetical protein